MARLRRLWLPLLLVACLAGCYLPSAGRRAARILERGWDPDERGALMILTGPVSLLHATADFLVHAPVPLDYDGYFLVDRREPSVQWFRRYGGPMLPLVKCRDLVSRAARHLRRGDPGRRRRGVAGGAQRGVAVSEVHRGAPGAIRDRGELPRAPDRGRARRQVDDAHRIDGALDRALVRRGRRRLPAARGARCSRSPRRVPRRAAASRRANRSGPPGSRSK